MSIFESGGLGAAITPEQWAKFVLDHLRHESVVIASGASVVTTLAKQIHVPRITADAPVIWAGEGDDLSGTGPTGDDLVLTPKKVGTVVTLGNETVADSDPNVLNATGENIMRAVALDVDKKLLAGSGTSHQPLGVINIDDVPVAVDGGSPYGDVDYTGLVIASGVIRGKGGNPDVAYISPADYTGLQLATDGMDRPLLQGTEEGPAPVVAGLRIYQTPALSAGTALVAEARQIVVGLRQDATLAISGDAGFANDITKARVTARVDVGVNDLGGLCLIGG